jgi:hypothetical protein
VCGNFDKENVHVRILENQMMMPFLAHGNGVRL